MDSNDAVDGLVSELEEVTLSQGDVEEYRDVNYSSINHVSDVAIRDQRSQPFVMGLPDMAGEVLR